MTDRYRSAEAVFATAAKRFYDELPNEDREIFQTLDNAEDMVASIEQHIVQLNSHRTSRLLEACKKLDHFRKSMDPFFEVVNIFVSTHPEWSGIAWGAVRLVFQLCSHFTGFFEKLAEMFQEFGRNLPNYSTQIKIINSRIKHSAWRETHECLFKALSFVYVDILQFCHDACRLFSKRRRGLWYKATIIWDLSWTPFDERFSEILGRLKRHQQDFDAGLENVYSEELIMHFNAMDLERVKNSQHRDLLMEQQTFEQRKIMDNKLQSLQKWIGAPNWTGPYEAAKGKRLPDTWLWILDQPEYKSWLEQEVPYPTQGSVFAKNVLVISAKPGYGKTILSTRIIEDLRRRTGVSGPSSDPSIITPTAYFYFDQQQGDRYPRFTALQSIAAQLLFSQKNNPTSIDLAALMMKDETQGQMSASPQSLESLIRIYLQRLNGSYFIFDGLDECLEWEEFLISLRKCAEGTSCKIVLLSRTHLSLSAIIGQKPFDMKLKSNTNITEIHAIVRPGIASLLQRGKLGKLYGLDSIDDLVNRLAKRSDSIVLWADLIIKYLQSPFLTPSERVEIVEEEKSFKGLDNLFGKILVDLGKRIPESQYEKVRKVFGWLAAAQRPWTTTLMETALAVQPHRHSTSEDFMDSFEESLMQLCGPLVEIRHDHTVRFIHLSVAQYLTLLQESVFSVSLSAAHCSTANLCLEYLLNEVPHEPLSGDSSITCNRESVIMRYCFLSYVVAFWPLHARQGFEEGLGDKSGRKFLSSKGCKDLSQLLLMLTTEKRLVTLWIEAAWTFEIAPSLFDLSEIIKGAARKAMEAQRAELVHLAKTLQRLGRNLSHLNQKWGHILVSEPNEIWSPSTNALTDCEFWVGTTAAKINWLSSNADAGTILIASQVSSNGKEVGVVRVWPADPSKANAWAIHGSSAILDLPHPTNWVVFYQIWCLESMKLKTKNRFFLPAEKVLSTKLTLNRPREFRFPVALSSSLRLAFIMGVIIQVQDSPHQAKALKHLLFGPRCRFNAWDERMLNDPNKPKYFYNSGISTNSQNSSPNSCHKWFRCYFSPDEQYLAVIKGESAPDALRFNAVWVLDVHRRNDPLSPEFQLLATTGIRLDGNASHTVIFHPNKLILAISMKTSTSLWRVSSNDAALINICDYPLTHMRFSNCGNFLYGLIASHEREGEPVFLNITSHLDSFLSAITDGSSPSRTLQDPQTVLGTQDSFPRPETEPGVEGTAIQVSGMPEFTSFQGQLQMSALTQDLDSGSVMLQTLRANGEFREEKITRLPKSLTLEKSYSTLVPAESHRNLRLVLDKAIQETYSTKEIPDFQLPAVLDRDKSSIPTTAYDAHKHIGPNSLGKRVIEDISEDVTGEGPVMKKRKELAH
ncbi:hypothetical protein BDZ45DRAFT_730184 [Acephala macrosclerotiorum]|nr:hypothetical protein BDZ45DRAFT_730184 [Acephala macrosclerotiorum]